MRKDRISGFITTNAVIKVKNWIDINGETLKRLGKDVQYGSLEDYISKGTNPSIKICIGRKLSTSFGTSKNRSSRKQCFRKNLSMLLP